MLLLQVLQSYYIYKNQFVCTIYYNMDVFFIDAVFISIHLRTEL